VLSPFYASYFDSASEPTKPAPPQAFVFSLCAPESLHSATPAFDQTW
jgi:hypothetical protein